MVADRADIMVDKCFKNKVVLGFSKQQDLPGANIRLQLKAAPNSLCSVRAVDLSVLLLKPEEELTADSVYAMFPFTDRSGYPYEVDEFVYVDPCLGPIFNPRPVAAARSFYPFEPPDIDVFYMFKENGLKILTNCDIKVVPEPQAEPRFCRVYLMKEGLMTSTAGPLPGEAMQPNMATQQEPARTYFPETWIWSLFSVGPSGKRDVPVTLPDSITEWKSMSFCTADLGFGLSTTASVTAFKPFFVELTLPYSVVRGEGFPLKATVFNYLKQCIVVQISLAPSPTFQIEPCTNCSYSHCLCADEAFTFSWGITATTLGLVKFLVTTKTSERCGQALIPLPQTGLTDSLEKPLLVRPEGVPEEKTRSALLCPKGSPVTESFTLDLPSNVIQGSGRAEVSVLGDIMGTALQNLDQLIQMPYGCGEQNMVTFAPIIYVVQYLEKTGQLKPDIKTRALGYLTSGYQRELNYKHSDGSYSAFGESDGVGSTWLTAFVMKCFGQARQYVFIDDKTITDAETWLYGHQNGTTGCFQSLGMLFHTAMKGGVDDEVSLSAYITGALLELGRPASNPSVASGLNCLRAALGSITSVYTQALLAYVFTLAGDEAVRTTLLAQLDSVAIATDGQMHWTYTSMPPATPNYWSEPLSVDVETTAYVLLALLSVTSVSSADINKATQIVAWLSRQQNAYGGYSSTQDTVVALQALAKYAAFTYTEQGVVTVSVRTAQGSRVAFTVNNVNRLLLQQKPLTQIPGVYLVAASGQGCAYVQATLRYNIPPPANMATFKLGVETDPDTCRGQNPGILDLSITVRYTGSRNVSNMAIIEVRMLSGYSPWDDVSAQLLKQPFVKRVEIQLESVSIYLDEVRRTDQTYQLTVNLVLRVRDIKPASVKVFDYYQPEEQAVVDYRAPCS